MLELLAFPKRDEKHSAKLFLVGLIYSSLAYLLVKLVFVKDVVLASTSGMMVVMFTSLFSIIFFFYALRRDEQENIQDRTDSKAISDNWKILKMFIFLFLGFMVGFLLCQVLFPQEMLFNSQMQTYCVINKPLLYQDCLDNNKITETLGEINRTGQADVWAIFSNNITVSIGILIFSIIFGAGVIFIIAWNASIIASVIAFLAQYNFRDLPIWFARFMIHGIPEIGGYFLIAMAGGMSSFAIASYFKGSLSKDNFLKVIRRAILLVFISILVLVGAALIEGYVSPLIN